VSSHSHSAGAAHRHGRTGGFVLRPKWLLGGLAVVAAAAVLYFSDIDWRAVPAMLERINRPLALLVMATLPIVGFPISAVYLAAGAIFGPWVGGVVVLGITLVHVLVTNGLARTVLRKHIERWRKKWSKKIPKVPEDEHATLVAMIVIVPALPYLARNCLLALAGVPWRYLLGVAVPLYVARSYVTIFLGDLGNDPSVRALVIIGSVFAFKLGISALLFHRLRQHSRSAS
jgi:uncharacterized membrane protein YdjX (TVP38/TMEM64 family)